MCLMKMSAFTQAVFYLYILARRPSTTAADSSKASIAQASWPVRIRTTSSSPLGPAFFDLRHSHGTMQLT